MARFLNIKSFNPKLKQIEIGRELGISFLTLERRRNDKNMLSFYRIPPNSHKIKQAFSNTNLDDNSKHERDVKRPQLTSNAVSAVNTATNKKSKLDGGSMYQIDENNDEHLGEILHNKNL